MPLRPARPTRPDWEDQSEGKLCSLIHQPSLESWRQWFSLTNSVQEQFGLRGEVVVDNIVQQGDVYTTSSNISHQQHHGLPMHKFPNIDLSGGLIEGTVDVGTLHTLQGQQLERNPQAFVF